MAGSKSLRSAGGQQEASRMDMLARMRPWLLAACAISTTFLLLLQIDNQLADSVEHILKMLITVVGAVALFTAGFGLAQELERRRGGSSGPSTGAS